jgi:LysM repeat protein
VYDDPATSPRPRTGDHEDDRAADDPHEIARPPAIGEDRSPNARVCPFLRAIDDADVLGLPVESPDPANRCAALRDAVPQSLRQQELVCLTSGHVNCPRYLRGSLGGDEPPERAPKHRAVTPAIAGSLAVLVVAFLVSIAFVVGNGGLALTGAATTPTASGAAVAALASRSPAPTPAPTPASTPIANPSEASSSTPSPSEASSPAPTPSRPPSSSPSPPSPTSAPTAKPTAKPTSSRLALLKPCPDAPNCYLYVIRSGDNLYSIANYFGVSVKAITVMNPWTANGLKVGRALRLPPPTR